MEDDFLEELKGHTKVTFYVLPLLCLNKFSFDDKFIDAYINREGTHLCVALCQGADLHIEVTSNPYLISISCTSNVWQLWFRLPGEYLDDVQLFILGRYGDLSDEAKSMIRAYSGLPYRMTTEDDLMVTDYRLLALDRSHWLKQKWDSLYELEEGVITEGMDLINPPGERDFRSYKQ